MEVVICPTDLDAGRLAADKVAEVAQATANPVLGVATGSSPLGVYQALARRVAAGELDLTDASAFALDEYVGLGPDHPQSYARTIRETVTIPLGLNPERVHVPDGMAPDLLAGAQQYEQDIAAAGGIDVQILGIGSNGHIGFNEPTSSFASRTRVKTLTRQTRSDNARFFADPAKVPHHCVTQGLATILESKLAILVATGESKAAAVAAMVEGPVSSMCPGSILQFHPQAVIFVDQAAASQLNLTNYYEYIAVHKNLVTP